MNKYPHIHQDYQANLLLSAEQRIETLYEPIWINYPRTIEVIQLLQNLITRPQKPRMQNLLVIGESNNGKTSLINHFCDLYPDYTYEDDEMISQPVKPVIMAQFPASADEKGLYIAILECFWAPFRPTDTTAKLRHQTIHLLRQCNVRMLILDEIHNLLAGTAAKQRMVMNMLKNLGNELQIPIIGVGTKDAALILNSDPQHASRFDLITVPKWELNKEYRSLLKSFEGRLPLKNASNLDSKDKATKLYSISDGNLGDLHRLLIECTISALKQQKEEITLDIIQSHSWLKKTNGTRRL